MNVTPTDIADVVILEPKVYTDDRGSFFESFHVDAFRAATGFHGGFVQDNQSTSRRHVLRGLHYQDPHPQGKLIRAVTGVIFDVAVDIRRKSPTFGRWVGIELSAENHRQLWVPPGLAHGFLTLSESADVLYKATDFYAPGCERCIRWDDPTFAVAWPLTAAPVLSPKDAAAAVFSPGN